MAVYTPKVPYRFPNSNYTQWISIYERLSIERIIFLGGTITDGLANSVVARLLYMDSEDSSKDIFLYINSPGGSVRAGLAIYDTMQSIKADVVTIAVGMAMSMAAFILATGTKGKRYALPNAEIMLHQSAGETQGQATDIAIEAKEILRLDRRINEILSAFTGQPIEKLEQDQQRDFYLTAQAAKEYGLIDKVLEHKE
jgi:ATP-dependent Clp protease protease subunit